MATYAEPTGTTAIGVKPRRASWLRRIAWRLLGAIFVIWAAATFVFFVQQLLPGNQATLIKNEQTGFLVGSVAEAVQALKRLPEIDRRACRKRVEECFSIETMVEGYERVYAAIFERQPSS